MKERELGPEEADDQPVRFQVGTGDDANQAKAENSREKRCENKEINKRKSLLFLIFFGEKTGILKIIYLGNFREK
jgi:hypothetical protein